MDKKRANNDYLSLHLSVKRVQDVYSILYLVQDVYSIIYFPYFLFSYLR